MPSWRRGRGEVYVVFGHAGGFEPRPLDVRRAPDRQAGAVEGVDKGGLVILAAIARHHAPRLELAADRAGGNLAIGVLARQPDLDVIGLGRAEAGIASCKQRAPIRKPKAFEQDFRVAGVFYDYGSSAGVVVMSRRTYDRASLCAEVAKLKVSSACIEVNRPGF